MPAKDADDFWAAGFNLRGLNAAANALTVYQGRLIAGGFFSTAGGAVVSNIAA